DWRSALAWAEGIQRLDRHNEQAALLRAEALTQSGAAREAMHALEAFCAQDGDASDQTRRARAMLARLRAGQATVAPFGEAPIVGRQGELHRVDALLEHAQAARGGALVFIGAPGVGKTR